MSIYDVALRKFILDKEMSLFPTSCNCQYDRREGPNSRYFFRNCQHYWSYCLANQRRFYYMRLKRCELLQFLPGKKDIYLTDKKWRLKKLLGIFRGLRLRLFQQGFRQETNGLFWSLLGGGRGGFFPPCRKGGARILYKNPRFNKLLRRLWKTSTTLCLPSFFSYIEWPHTLNLICLHSRLKSLDPKFLEFFTVFIRNE